MTIDDVFAEFVVAACVPLDHTSPDGKRFLMIRRDEGSAPRQLNVILNWSGGLERSVADGRR